MEYANLHWKMISNYQCLSLLNKNNNKLSMTKTYLFLFLLE